MIMMIFLFIFSILGVMLFSKVMPHRFGHFFLAIFTLFQVMTLDDWFALVSEVREDKNRPPGEADQSGAMFYFFMLFIMAETMIFINLFIAVIVSNVESVNLEMAQQQRLEQEQQEGDKAAMLGIDPRLLSGAGLGDSLRDAQAASSPGGAEGSKNDTPEGTDLDGTQGSKGLESLEQLHGYEYFHPRDKELLKEYLMLLASADSQMERYSRQMKTMDDLVDIVEKADFLREGVIDIDAEGGAEPQREGDGGEGSFSN